MKPSGKLAFTALAVAFLGAGPAHAAPARGALVGKELSLAKVTRSGLESLAGSLLGGGLQGRVTRAVVDEDEPRRLVVRVAYEGLQGASLWGELLNGERRRQAGIAMGEAVTVPDASGEIVLTFEAEPEALPTRSALLRISVMAPNRRTPSYVRVFELGKGWSAPEVSGKDFSVTVTPRPIGRTAELGATPSMVVPASSVRSAPAPVSTDATSATTFQRAAPAPASPPPTSPQSGTARSIVARPMRSAAQPVTGATAAKTAAIRAPALANEQIRFVSGLNPADASRGARGPGALPLRPFGEVRTEDINLDLTRVLNVFPEVYQDQESSSGIFYFLPHGYALAWDEAEGYELKAIYSAAAEGAAGQVMMAARLDGGIGPRDLDIAARIVQAYAAARGLAFRELRALPIDTLAISLSDDLGRYSIPPDRVSVHGLSDVTGRLDVSWITDERTKNFIQEALVENVGINGSVTYAPTGGGLGPRMVPIRMQLADYSTFGPFRWDRTGWKNTTPYPITLRYLHALRVPTNGPAVVNSWNLDETRVPPGGQVRWSATSVPSWIDGQAQKVWIDYTVDASCRPCGTASVAALTGGVSTAGSSQITFHSLTPLAETGAHDIVVEVRSRHFDPRGEQLQTRSVVLDADGKDFLVGPLFVDGPSDTGGGTMFEFRLSLTMKDGDTVTGNAAWIPGSALRVPIGRKQLERSVGALPSP